MEDLSQNLSKCPYSDSTANFGCPERTNWSTTKWIVGPPEYIDWSTMEHICYMYS